MAFAVMMIVSFLEMCLVSFAILTSGHQQLQPRTSKIHEHFLRHFAPRVLMLKKGWFFF